MEIIIIIIIIKKANNLWSLIKLEKKTHTQ